MGRYSDAFRVAIVLDERGSLLSTGITAGDTAAGARFLVALDGEIRRFVERTGEVARAERLASRGARTELAREKQP